MKIPTTAFAMIIALAVPGYAVTTGVDFLKLSVGARQTGMGESAAGMYADVSAVCWNPAGTARIDRPQLGVMHSEAVVDASLDFLGAAYPVSRFGVVSVGVVRYAVKPIPVTLGDSQSLGDLNWTDTAVIMTFARDIVPRLSGGISAKVIRRMESDPIFGASEGTACAVDAGCIYRTPVPGLNAGCAVLNTGTELRMTGEKKNDVLPQTVRLGAAYEYRMSGAAFLTAACDIVKILGGAWFPGGGIEMKLHDIVFIRTGYYAKEGNIQGTTYGFGICLKRFEFEYSNVPASEMVGYSRNNKISMVVRF